MKTIDSYNLITLDTRIFMNIIANSIQQLYKYNTLSPNVTHWNARLVQHLYIIIISHVNKINTIISVDAEKAFYKVQQAFMIKILKKVSIEGKF